MKSKRIRYFFGHLAVSVIVSLCAVLWVFLVWHPTPLAEAVGLTGVFLIMVIVDVVIGPLLSLVIYKEGKRYLKIDLVIIAIVQICALCYGLYNIAEGRPVWVVYNVDRFELVRYNEIYQGAIDKAKPEYRQAGWLMPQYVAVAFADNAKERAENTLEEVMAGISLAQRPERYVPLEQASDDIKKRALSLDGLDKYNDKAQVQSLLTNYPSANAYLPLKATQTDMTVLVDKNSGEVIKIVDLRPWETIQ